MSARTLFLGALSSSLLVAACTQPQPIATDGGTPAADVPSSDAPAPDLDAGAGLDAPSTPDVPAVDAPPGADAAAPDAGADALLDAGSDAGRTCDEIYGGAPMYQLCAETPTSCEFFSRTAGSCTDACRLRGGTCLEAYQEGVPVCVRMTTDTCGAASLDRICVCTR